MRDERAQRRRRRLTAFTYGLVGLLLVGALWSIVRIGQIANAIEKQQDQNTRTLALVESCATPEGACSQLAAEQRDSVGQLVREYTALVVICADRRGTQDAQAIRACVRKEQRKAEQ